MYVEEHKTLFTVRARVVGVLVRLLCHMYKCIHRCILERFGVMHQRSISAETICSQFVGFATDGAAPAMGRWTGTARFLGEKVNPTSTVIHCHWELKLAFLHHVKWKKVSELNHFHMFVNSRKSKLLLKVSCCSQKSSILVRRFTNVSLKKEEKEKMSMSAGKEKKICGMFH